MAIVATDSNPVRATLDAPTRWQQAMKSAIRDAATLCRHLELPDGYIEPAIAAEKSFPVFAPLGFVDKMRRGDPHDPLLRQVLPLGEEMDDVDGFSTDPVGEEAAQVAPGLLQKYPGRALMITTGACAIHCRYCFRRHYPYSEAPRSVDAWQEALDQIAGDESINEVILSGGDPLTLVDWQLAELTNRIAAIPHVATLRVHTRLPIVVPERVTDELLDWLLGTRLMPMVVVHANHPREIDDAVADALRRLVARHIIVLNQAVLMRGINDDLGTLVSLSRRLIDLRVMPYYLHQLDRVAGAAHFEVPADVGRELIAELRQRLPGYAVPTYVREDAGALSKTTIAG